MVWTPLKNISQLGRLFPTYGKLKNVPNHQPVTVFVYMHSKQLTIHPAVSSVWNWIHPPLDDDCFCHFKPWRPPFNDGSFPSAKANTSPLVWTIPPVMFPFTCWPSQNWGFTLALRPQVIRQGQADYWLISQMFKTTHASRKNREACMKIHVFNQKYMNWYRENNMYWQIPYHST